MDEKSAPAEQENRKSERFTTQDAIFTFRMIVRQHSDMAQELNRLGSMLVSMCKMINEMTEKKHDSVTVDK